LPALMGPLLSSWVAQQDVLDSEHGC